ncbi:hypothetical protein WJX75_007269 [Coccomyxa subellipsoidea]|uniref:Sec1-like protein n=1 Tax=Coccomyxa subellipsoidea TaxID=248742 RepID=A0ABR2YUE5_9CHLO
MAAILPNYNEGPLALGHLREEARRLLIELLDSRRGKKVLVLDPKVSGFLGLLAEVSLLKEHGIEQLLHLSTEPLGDLGVRNVIYLVRASIENAKQIAEQIKETNRVRAAAGFEYAVYFLPRRTIACERIFQEEGVYGDIVAGEFPLGFIPFDYDLLSLELGTAYRELVAEGDRSSLYGVARALTRLQALYGGAAMLKGKGPAAAAVRSLLLRMRQELGPEAPITGGGPIDEIILLDREVDAVTPMCTQLTYEGLVDETMQIKYAVGPQLGQRAKSIQSDYKTSKAAERSLAELKEFASQLKALPNIQRHIGLAEAVNRAIAAPAFRARVSVEQSLLDGHGLDASAESIEEMMCNEEDLFVVLRLMCLLSLTQGGVPKKYYDALRKEVLHSYGHEYMLMLSKLQDAGLLVKHEGGKGNFTALKRAFRLLVDDVDDKNPTDIAYVFSGYAPLSVRLVEAAVKGPGWGVGEEVLRLLPGPSFEVEQTSDDKGLPIEKPAQDRKLTGVSKKRRVVVVVFMGGITFAEIAALRFLGSQPEVNCAFVIATTKLINGTSLLESIVDDSIKTAKEVAVL